MKVVFLYDPAFNDRASTYMRTQLLKEIYDRQFKDGLVEVKSVDDVDDIKDCVVVVNKNCSNKLRKFIPILSQLVRQHNRVYNDMIDQKIAVEYLGFFHGVISSSLKQTSYFNKHRPGIKVHQIIHPTDNKIVGVDNSSLKEAKVCYWGAPHNTHLDLRDVTYLNSEEEQEPDVVRKFLSEHNVHLATRTRNRWDGFKPFTKGFIACKCNSVIITAREDSDAYNYLGEEYPFYTKDNSAKSCQDMINHVIKSYGTEEWDKAMKCMKIMKDYITDEIIATQIRNLVL